MSTTTYQNEDFRSFFQTMDDLIFVCSMDRKVVYTNNAVTSKLGYSWSEIKNMTIREFYPENYRKEADQIVFEILKGIKDCCQLPLLKKNGDSLPAETKVWLGKWNGQDCLYGISKDLTKQQAALDRFQKLFDNNPALMAVNSINDRKFIDVNSTFLNTLGYAREEIIGKTASDLPIFIEDDNLKEALSQLQKNGRIQDVELKVRRKDGSILYGIFYNETIDNQGEKVILTAMIDITKQRDSEREALEAKMEMTAILNNLPFLAWLKDENGRFMSVNKQFAEACGKSIDDIVGYTDYEVCNEELTLKYITDDEEVVKSREKKYYEEKIEDRRGEIWFETYKTPIFGLDGSVTGTTGIARDITEKKKMMHLIESQEKKFRLLFENMTNGFSLHEVILNDNGEPIDFKCLMVNKAYENQMNQRAKDIIGKTMLEINPHADKATIQMYCNVAITGTPLHMEYLSKTFNRYFRTFTYSPQKGLFALISEDITDKKQMEEELTKISERLKLATKAANVGIWEYDILNNSLVWDDAMYRLYGVSEDEFSGAYEAWERGLHPDDLEISRQHLKEAILGNRDFNPEFRVVWNDGSIHHIKANSVVLRDKKGKPLKMIGTNWDVTERINYEKELLKAKEAAEAASIMKSQFLANMSHEIRTPMNGVLGYLNLVEKTNLSLKQKNYIQEAKSASEILLYLINDILDFSKIEAGKLTMAKVPFNLRSVINEAVSMLLPKAEEKNLSLFTQIKSSVPSEIEGDPARLIQVLNNLIGNAVKFTNQGEIKVVVEATLSDKKVSVIKFQVKDTGIGIDEETVSKLFKPFIQGDASRTRKFGGTGLGLAISKELVKMMGGTITLESVPGEGSTFTFIINAKVITNNTLKLEKGDANTSSIDFNNKADNIKQKILLVEDNKMNQRLLVEILKQNNLTCDVVDDGSEAVKIITEHEYDIVFMDCNMPIMDGFEATKKIREMEGASKHTYIVAMTANAMEGDREKCLSAGMDYYISKPINASEIIRLIINKDVIN